MVLSLVDIALLYGVLLASLVVHEAAHATVALLGGDRTAYLGGQVTLNPIPHIRREPFGTVILPLAMLLLSKMSASGGFMFFGYASTPIDPAWAYRHPRRAALMSAAGPLSNFLLAALAFGVLKLLVAIGQAELDYPYGFLQLLHAADGSQSGALVAVIRIASVFLCLNVLLGMLNLIPLPPLDGAGVVEGLFPRQTRGFYAFLRGQPLVFVIVLILIWRFLPDVYLPTMDWLRDALG